MFHKVTGPYYITLTMDHDSYGIGDVKTNKPYGSPVHVSRLRPYQNRELSNTEVTNATQTILADSTINRTTQPVQTQTTQNNEWFAVDRIMNSKLTNVNKHYLIKWKGQFPNSLEPEEHVNDYYKQ